MRNVWYGGGNLGLATGYKATSSATISITCQTVGRIGGRQRLERVTRHSASVTSATAGCGVNTTKKVV